MRNEMAAAPLSRPACCQARRVPCSCAAPSRSRLTRQPPVSSIGMAQILPDATAQREVSWPHRSRVMDDRKNQGVEATNQAFVRYDQVNKKQEYHLAEGRHQEAFDEETRIRTCDIGRFLHGTEADKQDFARELGGALRSIGFAILEGHGISSALYREAEERTEQLFGSTSLDDKLRFRARRHGSVNQGYFPIKETSGIHPDLVEGWVFCRRAFDLDGDAAFRWQDYWPRGDAEPFFRQLVQAHERLILPVMQSLLRDLGCDPPLYDRKLSPTTCGQRLNHYPPLTAASPQPGAGRRL